MVGVTLPSRSKTEASQDAKRDKPALRSADSGRPRNFKLVEHACDSSIVTLEESCCSDACNHLFSSWTVSPSSIAFSAVEETSFKVEVKSESCCAIGESFWAIVELK